MIKLNGRLMLRPRNRFLGGRFASQGRKRKSKTLEQGATKPQIDEVDVDNTFPQFHKGRSTGHHAFVDAMKALMEDDYGLRVEGDELGYGELTRTYSTWPTELEHMAAILKHFYQDFAHRSDGIVRTCRAGLTKENMLPVVEDLLSDTVRNHITEFKESMKISARIHDDLVLHSGNPYAYNAYTMKNANLGGAFVMPTPLPEARLAMSAILSHTPQIYRDKDEASLAERLTTLETLSVYRHYLLGNSHALASQMYQMQRCMNIHSFLFGVRGAFKDTNSSYMLKQLYMPFKSNRKGSWVTSPMQFPEKRILEMEEDSVVAPLFGLRAFSNSVWSVARGMINSGSAYFDDKAESSDTDFGMPPPPEFDGLLYTHCQNTVEIQVVDDSCFPDMDRKLTFRMENVPVKFFEFPFFPSFADNAPHRIYINSYGRKASERGVVPHFQFVVLAKSEEGAAFYPPLYWFGLHPLLRRYALNSGAETTKVVSKTLLESMRSMGIRTQAFWIDVEGEPGKALDDPTMVWNITGIEQRPRALPLCYDGIEKKIILP